MNTSHEVNISVRGESPKPWSTNEWDWRQAVFVAARDQARQSGGLAMADGSYFEVEITFYLMPQSYSQADLDNLAKPVLDTLFHARYPQARMEDVTGALLSDVDDDRVIRLQLEKLLVSDEDEVGADIAVRVAG